MFNYERTPLPAGYSIYDPDGSEYKITGILGEGGSGIIYTAKGNYTDVLIKEIFPIGKGRYHRENDGSIAPRLPDKYMRKLENEYNSGQNISDKVAWVSPIWRPFRAANGSIFAVMNKRQPGISLRTLLTCSKSAKIGIRDWMRLILTLTAIIRDIHNMVHVLHLDISPSNILILGDDEPGAAVERIIGNPDIGISVQIIDFGSSVGIDDNGQVSLSSSSPTTDGFSAPELYWNGSHNVDSRTDIFSICACLDACVSCMSGEKYQKLKPTVRAKIEEIISKGTDDDILYRWQDTEILITQIDEVIHRIDGKGVSKALLWETGRNRITDIKNNADFDIVESILPSGQESVRRTEYAHLSGEKSRKLEELLDEITGNVYLVGEGGIGKTTSMIHFADKKCGSEYTDDSVVPIYIELSECHMVKTGIDLLDKDYENTNETISSAENNTDISITAAHGMSISTPSRKNKSSSSYIIYRYIISLLSGDLMEGVDSKQLGELNRLFSKKPDRQPEYILLLDGLNEVSSKKISSDDGSYDRIVVRIIIDEISKIIEKCPNVRVILTSRNDDEAIRESSIRRIYLTGVSVDVVNTILDEADISEEKKKTARNNKALMEILKVPLFLSIYARIAADINVEDAAEISTRGELLKAFFIEKRKNIYSELSHLEQRRNLPLDYIHYSFILEHVIPKICMAMADTQSMELSEDDIFQYISDALSPGELAYAGFGIRSKPRKHAESLKALEAKTAESDPDASPVLDAIVKMLSVFYKRGEDKETKTEIFRIRHQHFRDYFAAMYIVNLMESARASLKASIKKETGKTDDAFKILYKIRRDVLPGEVIVFIGEILGEHHNIPQIDGDNLRYVVPSLDKPQDRNLIKQIFEVFRGRFDDSVGYAVYNLIEALKTVRGSLCGEDLNRLDLRRCSLNGVKLGENGCIASFGDVLIDERNILPVGHSGLINSVAYSPECTGYKYIATASSDKTIKIWDAKTFALIKTLEGHLHVVNSAAYSPDGRFLVSASSDTTIKIWDVKSFALVATLVGHSDVVSSAEYSPDGRFIVSASWDETIKIWDAQTREILGTFEGHIGGSSSAVYSPDGRFIVSASNEGCVKIWDALTLNLVKTLKVHAGAVNSVAYSPGCTAYKHIITSSCDTTIKIWNAKNFVLIKTLEGHSDFVNSAVYSPDGRFIVSASNDNTIKVWDAETFELIITLEGHSSWVNNVVYSPDGKFIVSTSGDDTIKIWDASTFSLVKTLEGYLGGVISASYSPDGRFIVSASCDKTVKIWDAGTFILVKTLEGHSDSVNNAAYSPDGRFIISASDDNIVKVWDAETFALVKIFEGQFEFENKTAYSSDGRFIVTASEDNSEDNTVKIWDAETFNLVARLKGHTNKVTSAAYSPECTDGKYIISASHDGTIKIWDSSTHECTETIQNIPGLFIMGVDMRNLRPDSDLSNKTKKLLRHYGAII